MWRIKSFLILALLAYPVASAAIELRWSSGAANLSFTAATRCTLIATADSAEQHLPAEWRLPWLADCQILPLTVTAPEAGTAEACDIRYPATPAEMASNLVTVGFCSATAGVPQNARYVLDLPGGSAGKLKVVALNSADTTQVVESNEVTFNGGVTGDFPPLAMVAIGDHTTTLLSVRCVGAGLGAVTSASLVAADTSWRVPLTITEAADSAVTAEAEVPTQLPDGILQLSTASDMSAAVPLPASQVTGPQLAPVTIRGNSWLVPADSAGISPKDFAFFYNTVPTATPGLWRGLFHLIYIRHLPNGQELTLGHAWSPDLSNWTFDRYAFRTGPAGSWDVKHVWAPSVVQNGNLWYMFYTGVDAADNQRIGRVTTALLDTTNTVWSITDRKMVFAADSTSWVARHPASFSFADQFRDPFVFQDPDSAGRFLMVYTALDTNYKAQSGLSVGLARNIAGTLDRWKDRGRYGVTDFGRNGHFAQVEGPHVIPDSSYAPPYWITHDRPKGWRVMYTWGGDHPTQTDSLTRVVRKTGTVNVADTSSANWGATQTLFSYLSGDATVAGWNGSEHLKAGNVDFLAAFNAYFVDGIQISRMYWRGADFSLKVPELTAVDEAGSVTANVRLDVLQFDPRARRVRFRISLPTALSVRFDVYDVAGRRLQRLVDRHLPAGKTTVEWDRASAGSASVPSGVYFARLSYQSGSRIAKIPLIR